MKDWIKKTIVGEYGKLYKVKKFQKTKYNKGCLRCGAKIVL